MDMVYKRYADPLSFMGVTIRTGRFKDFTIEVMNFHNKDIEEKTTWEMWLHKVFDKSYGDFLKSLNVRHETTNKPTREEQTAIVRNSIDMLNNFKIVGETNENEEK